MTIVGLSQSSFSHNLDNAKPGQWLMYHVGYLYEERTKNRRLNALAHSVYAKYLEGKVCLVQRRLGDKSYEYYAVKRCYF
jgi:hypothetical protein